jgi:hypothetical protein
MTDAPVKIWVYHTTNHAENGAPYTASEWSEAPLKGSTKYIRYDKHTGYLSDIRAAYGEACEQRAELEAALVNIVVEAGKSNGTKERILCLGRAALKGEET